MNPLSIYPQPQLGIAVLALAIGFGSGWAVNGWRLGTSIQKDRAVRAEQVVAAVQTRIEENTADEVKSHVINQKIEATKNEELAPVIQRVTSAPRMRVGPSICSATARAPEAQGTSSSDGADTGGRLVSVESDEAIRALILKTEEALATGRACQSFVRENDMVP